MRSRIRETLGCLALALWLSACGASNSALNTRASSAGLASGSPQAGGLRIDAQSTGPENIVSVGSGLCMNVTGASTSNAAAVIQWACGSQPNSMWALQPMGNGQYEIVSQNSGLCLDDPAFATANGTPLDQWSCVGSANELWTLKSSGSGYEIISVNSGTCLDDPGFSTTQGQQLDIWSCSGGTNQQWQLGTGGTAPAPAPAPATSPAPTGAGPENIVSVGSGLCMNVTGASTSNAAAVIQWACGSQPNSMWALQPMGNGQYEIVSQNSGLCLDDPAFATANGTPLDQWSCVGSANELWTLKSSGSGYEIISVNSGTCLDDPGFSTTQGQQLDIWSCSGGTNQQWQLGTGGTAPAPAPAPATSPAPTGAAYYVSPGGNDGNSGTSVASPFATLARAQSAMQGSSVKTTYLRAGTYSLGSTLNLGSADTGETWSYYPPDGVDTAILDGGTSTTIAFNLNGAPNVTINGLKMRNFRQYTIYAYSSPGTIIENNDIGSMTIAPPVEMAGAVCGVTVGDHVRVQNNYFHDLSSLAVATYAYASGSSVDGTVITGNVVLNSVLQSSDNGAIYVSMDQTGNGGGHVVISNNFIRDTGSPSYTGVRDIYLDDNSSNVTVTGNIVGPPSTGAPANGSGFNAVFEHNGDNNVISGNVIDLGGSSYVNPVTWGYDGGSLNGMANNAFTGNLIISNFTGPQNVNSGYGDYAYLEAPESSAPASWFTVTGNVYWNYAAGGQVFYNGNLTNDAKPVIENPQISGYLYSIAAGSPVSGSPVSFPAIVGGWGPPGFTIPSSTNHSD